MLHLPDGYVRKPLPGKNAWIAALRSGKYKQGKNFLCRDESYCCMAVLCEVQGRPKTDFGVGGFDYDNEDKCLSRLNPLYAPLNRSGCFPNDVYYMWRDNIPIWNLADLNDCGANFTEIADTIDQVWFDEQLEQP